MEIEHFSHKHRLTLREEEKKEGANEVYCSGCREPIDGQAYICSECNFFLHKKCAELRHEMLHPFHPPHPLTLHNYIPDQFRSNLCDACRKRCHGFGYRCDQCDFDLCLDCAPLTPDIKYEGHDHLLSFFEKLHRVTNKCDVCDTLCDAFVFCCVLCKFNIHVRCFSSLPRTITHKCHSCLLTLTYPLTFLARSGKSLDFNCGVCGKKGNPKDSVYYCADCDYGAHIECVISEVLSKLVLKRESVPRTEETILVKLDEEIKKLRAELDPTLAKLDQEIAKLCDEGQEMKAKLELLENERAQRGASAGAELEHSDSGLPPGVKIFFMVFFYIFFYIFFINRGKALVE